MSEVKTKSKKIKIKISAPYSKENLPHMNCIVFKYVQYTEIKFI